MSPPVSKPSRRTSAPRLSSAQRRAILRCSQQSPAVVRPDTAMALHRRGLVVAEFNRDAGEYFCRLTDAGRSLVGACRR